MGYNSKILADAIKKLNERKVASKPKDIPLDVKGNGMLDPRFAGKPVKLNTDTLYNPTPYKIKAVADNGTERILNPFDESDVYFPGANTITEYPIGEYIDAELTDEEIKVLRDGGYVVEELPEMQPGGSFKPGTGYKMPALNKSEIAAVKKEVSKAKPVTTKLTGTVGKSTSSSKVPVKKTFGVTPSGKKVITTVSTKTDEISNKAKEDAAYEKFLDQNLGKEGSNTYTYVDPITNKTEQREYSNAHLKDNGNISVDEATWNANRDRQNMQHLSEALSGVGEITGINSAIRTGERLIDDPLKFADDLTTGISQAPETLVEGAMTLGSKLFGDNKDYVDVDTDALGVALDVAAAMPLVRGAGKGLSALTKGFAKGIPGSEYMTGYNKLNSGLTTLGQKRALLNKNLVETAGKLPDTLIKRRLSEFTNTNARRRTISSSKELEKKLKVDLYRFNKLQKQYPNLDFNNPALDGYLFTNKEGIEQIPDILKTINQNKKSGESFAKYLKKDFDDKIDFVKNTGNSVFNNVIDESPQYLDEVYAHLKNPKKTDEEFLNDLVIQSNTYTRFMKNPSNDLDYINRVRGRNIDNAGYSMDVEGIRPSDYYGSYGYKIQPSIDRTKEIFQAPLAEKWGKRIPTFQSDMKIVPGMHTGNPELFENALKIRNERINRIIDRGYQGEIPFEYRFKTTTKQNLPEEFIQSKYFTVPKHQVFSSPYYGQMIEGFETIPLGKLENKNYNEFFKDTGKGFKEGGYINKMSKGGEAIKVINYLMSQGLTRQQASGIAGNLQQESSFRPNAKGSLGHVGIAQWDKNDRWPKVKKYIESQGLDPFSLDGQLAGLVWEAKKRKDWDKILKTKTPEESAQTWLKHFEISGEKPGQKGYDNRLKYAKSLATQRDPNSPFDESVRDLVRLEAYREGLKNKSSVTASNEIPYRGIRYNYPTEGSSSNIDPLLTGAMKFNDDVTLEDIKPKKESSDLFASLLNMISAQEKEKEQEKLTEDPRQEVLKLLANQYPIPYSVIGNNSHQSFVNPYVYANDLTTYAPGGAAEQKIIFSPKEGGLLSFQSGGAKVSSPMASYYPTSDAQNKIAGNKVKAKPSDIKKSKSCGKGLVYDFEKGKCVPEKEIFTTEAEKTVQQYLKDRETDPTLGIITDPYTEDLEIVSYSGTPANQFTMGPQSAGNADWFWQAAALGPGLLKGAYEAAPTIWSALNTPINNIPQLTANNLLMTYFGAHSAANLADPESASRQSLSKAYENPTAENILDAAGNVSMDALGVVFSPGMGTALITGPLKNAYRLNPFAGKLGEYNRVVGPNAIEDLSQSGLVRAGDYGGSRLSGQPAWVGDRTTPYPSFGKGIPTSDNVYAQRIIEQGKKPYIISTNRPMRPSSLGRHGKGKTQFPVDETNKYMEAFPASEAQVFEFGKPHWWRGYKPIEVPKQLPGSGNVVPIVNNTPAPSSIQEMPGLHLKSTMSDGAVSKIVEPKTGLVNVEQALGIIGKESGGADKVALIKQGLGETIPKKMDYNEFRKVVQNQLIPLERQFATHNSNYGIRSLGYPSAKRSSYEAALSNTDNYIADLNKQIEITSAPIKKHYGQGFNGEHIYSYTDKFGIQYYPTEAGAIAGQQRSLANLSEELQQTKINLDYNASMLSKLPLENQTLILGNKGKFGRGSSAHSNPDETLGHIHFLRDAESPDVLTVTQIQSDAFQGTHRIMPKNAPDVSKAQISLQRMEELQEHNKSILNKMKTEGVDEAGLPVQDYQIKQFEDIVKAQEQSNLFKRAEIENFTQKQLLDKNHQERYLQELVNYAGERGDVNKLRLPTSETAAKIQGYETIDVEDVIRSYKTDPSFVKKLEQANDLEKKLLQEILEGKVKSGIYEPGHQTILKKYSEQPKMIKKLFGVEPKIVTDSKGNTWYEFDIPESYKQGKAEIKAFSKGGLILELDDEEIKRYLLGGYNVEDY